MILLKGKILFSSVREEVASQHVGPLAPLCGLVQPPETFSRAVQLLRGAWALLPNKLASHTAHYCITVAVWAATNRAAPRELAGCPECSSQDALTCRALHQAGC